MGITDYGTGTQTLAAPSLALWASSVATVLDNSDTPISTRLADPQYPVNTVPVSGPAVTLPANSAAHKVTLTANCAFTLEAPAKAGHTCLLHVSGAFTITFPASVKWDGGVAPVYASASVYALTTFDGGVSWVGVQSAKAIA